MGQHKHNPTAIKAKNGEIKPKEPKEKAMTKAQQKRAIEAVLKARGIFPVLPHTFGGDYIE